MRLADCYTVIVTPKFHECRDFYAQWFGFTPVFEASWFYYLESQGDHGYGIAFMSPDHPSEPPGPEAFSGKGAFVTLAVEDAAAEYERLRAAGLEMAYELRDEPWGQRRFAVVDPAGTWLDVVQQIEPEAGFWEPYMS